VSRESQRQQIFQLVALRDVDRLRGQTTQLVEAVPRVLAARQRESLAAQGSLEAAKAKLQGIRAHLRTLELDLQEREAGLNKASGNLLAAKTNQEYSLMQAEIARKRDEKGQAEEAILEQFELIKQGEGMVVEAEARLKEAQAEFTAFEERARRDLSEHQTELARLDERREQICRAIEPSVLKIYERAYKALGEGVSPIEGNVCQGCFSTITPNDRSRLISSLELIVCRSCSRIVYLPEVLQASHT